MVNPQARTEILQLLAALQQAWCALDFAAIRALWDTASDPIYFAEESAQAKLSWADLDAYWSLTEKAIARMGMRIAGEPLLRELAPGLVSAVYEMHWDALIRGEARPASATRATALCLHGRRREDRRAPERSRASF